MCGTCAEAQHERVSSMEDPGSTRTFHKATGSASEQHGVSFRELQVLSVESLLDFERHGHTVTRGLISPEDRSTRGDLTSERVGSQLLKLVLI